MASDFPDGISAERNLELRGRARHPWYRRALLCLIAVLPILALLNEPRSVASESAARTSTNRTGTA